MDRYPQGYGTAEIPIPDVGTVDGLTVKSAEDLLLLHDKAGPMQRRLLEDYPGAPDSLPQPFRDDHEYFDGAQFFLLHITDALRDAGYESVLTEEQHALLNTTNGLNDWWMDESSFNEQGARDYDLVIEVFDSINQVCYSYLGKPNEDGPAISSENPEVLRVAQFYDYVLTQMPEEYRDSLARLLISINLYQGVSLYQEKGFREHLGFKGLSFEDRDIGDEELSMLHRMRVEKGGFMLTYPWPFFPEVTNGIVIPDQPPTLADTIEYFLDGGTFYSDDGVGRRLVEVGGVLQLMDDSCDRELDWEHGVVSPENVGPAFLARSDEGWGALSDRIVIELSSLNNSALDRHHVVAVNIASSAVAGLTRYRANKFGNTDHTLVA